MGCCISICCNLLIVNYVKAERYKQQITLHLHCCQIFCDTHACSYTAKTKQAVPSVVWDYPWKLWCHLSGSGPQCSGNRLYSDVEHLPVSFFLAMMLFLRALLLSRCLASCTKGRGSEREGSPSLAAVMQISKRMLKSTVPIPLVCPPGIPALSVPTTFQWDEIQKNHNILHKEIQGQKRSTLSRA